MFPQRLEERRAWLRRGFSAAVEFALERRAHLFLQAGDLFDSPEPRNLERQFVAEALARLGAAGVRCLGIGGNHDTPRSRNGQPFATPQGTFARLGGMRLLEGRAAVDAETFQIEGVRVAVGGMAPDPTAAVGSDPLEGLEWNPGADVALLLLHGSLEGHVYPDAPEAIIRRRTVEGLKAVDYLVVGHVHRHVALRWGGRVVIVPGATERMTFAELENRPGFVYLEVEPGRMSTFRRVEVECQPRRQVVIPTSELGGDDPAEAVRARLEEVCDRGAMVRVALEGPITRQRYHALRLRELVEYGAGRSFFFDLDTTGLYVEDELGRAEARSGRLSQREELIRYARGCLEAAGTEEERSLIEEATRLILEGYQ